MKKLIVILLVTGIFTACSNSSTEEPKANDSTLNSQVQEVDSLTTGEKKDSIPVKVNADTVNKMIEQAPDVLQVDTTSL